MNPLSLRIHLQKQTGKEQMAYPTHAPGPGVGQAAAQASVAFLVEEAAPVLMRKP